MHRRRATALATLILLAGCAGPGLGQAATQESPSGLQSPGIAPPTVDAPASPDAGSARRAIADAVRNLVEADTARFEQRLTLGEGTPAGMRTVGAFELSSGSALVIKHAIDPDGRRTTIDHRIVDGTAYMQARGWPTGLAGCWLAFDSADLQELLGPKVARRNLDVILNAATVLRARGERFEPTDQHRIIGTVPTELAFQMLAPGALRRVDMSGLGGRTYAWFEVRGSRLHRWGIDGQELQQSLDEQDYPLDDKMRFGLSMLQVEVGYTRLGEPVRVTPPPPAERMSAAQMDSREGCAAS